MAEPNEKVAPHYKDDSLQDVSDVVASLLNPDRIARAKRGQAIRARRYSRRVDVSFGAGRSRYISPSVEPSSFGLTRSELETHGAQLRSDGWRVDEVCDRLANPRDVAA